MKIPAKVRSAILWPVALTSLITGFISCHKDMPGALKPNIKLSAAKDTMYVGERVLISLQLNGIDHRFQIVEQDSKKGDISDEQGKAKTDWSTDRNEKTMFYFTPMEEGIHELRFRAADDANQSASATLELTVKPHPFEVKAEGEQKEISTQESVDITLHIEDTIGTRSPKSLRCQNDLKGTFTIEGKPYTGEVPLSIGTKKDIAISFKALQSGQGKLHFTVSDKDKTTEAVSIPLTVTNPSFTVESTAEQDTIYVNKTAQVQLKINNGEYTQKTLSCHSDLGGSFTVGGQVCKANSTISIGKRDKVDGIVFKPAEIGTAKLGFTLQDEHQKLTSYVAIHAKAVPFKVELITESDQGARLADKGTIHVKITTGNVDASGITYHLSGRPISGTGKGTVSAYPTAIEADSTVDLTYIPNRTSGKEALGEHTISIEATDNYRQKATALTTFDVVRFPPQPTSLYAYYTRNGAKSRFIRLRKTGAFQMGDYPIDSIRVLLHNCRIGVQIDKTFPIDDLNKNDEIDILHYMGTGDHYKKDYHCVTNEAKVKVWLIDHNGNSSRPYDLTLSDKP